VGGNKVMNSFWEAHLPQHFVRPHGVDMLELKRFIIDKYVNKKYCDERFRSHPVTLETYHNHPLLGATESVDMGNNGGECHVEQQRHVSVPSHDLLQLGDDDDENIAAVHHHAHSTIGIVEEGIKTKEDEEDIWGDIEWVCDEQEVQEEDQPTGAHRGGASHADILAMFD
jgi:hypothetical protein